MAFPQSAQSTTFVAITPRDYDDPPEFPEDLSRSSIDDYRRQMSSWWTSTKANLRNLESDITALSKKVNTP